MIVTIDGPAGSGKSSTARAVASRLGFRHLDSGAFYRALTLAALEAGVPPEEWDALDAAAIDRFDVTAEPAGGGFRMRVDGRDVAEAIRSPDVNALVSHMARVPAVRDWLLDRLRAAGRNSDLVTDGRDMGTVIFPHADLKVYLIAEPRTRALRRLRERGIPEPTAGEVEAETARLADRDRIDAAREAAPLRRPEGAVDIDTTHLTFAEQVDRIVERVEAVRRHGGGQLEPG